jgi:uncharacterized radical SAM superfamily protein
MKKASEIVKISFVYPTRTKPLSITGESCSLTCAHCKGHYLKHMDTLWNIEGVDSHGFKSCLISGGCDSQGAVPLKDHMDLLKKLSSDYKLIAHTGLINNNDIEQITPYISAASFNFIGDDETIKNVMGLDRTKEDFISSLTNLSKKIKTFPHITLGLNKGSIKGEYESIDLLSINSPEALVFNVLIPTAGTDYANCQPPEIEDVIDVISYAKERMVNTGIYLGCMRPGGSYRSKLDEMCLDLGVDRIVMPGKSAKQKAQENGYEIKEKWECCIL